MDPSRPTRTTNNSLPAFPTPPYHAVSDQNSFDFNAAGEPTPRQSRDSTYSARDEVVPPTVPDADRGTTRAVLVPQVQPQAQASTPISTLKLSPTDSPSHGGTDGGNDERPPFYEPVAMALDRTVMTITDTSLDSPNIAYLHRVPYYIHQQVGRGGFADVLEVELCVPQGMKCVLDEWGEPRTNQVGALLLVPEDRFADDNVPLSVGGVDFTTRTVPHASGEEVVAGGGEWGRETHITNQERQEIRSRRQSTFVPAVGFGIAPPQQALVQSRDRWRTSAAKTKDQSRAPLLPPLSETVPENDSRLTGTAGQGGYYPPSIDPG